jgi:hypothetical protein
MPSVFMNESKSITELVVIEKIEFYLLVSYKDYLSAFKPRGFKL